jgi:hypothetical protein
MTVLVFRFHLGRNQEGFGVGLSLLIRLTSAAPKGAESFEFQKAYRPAGSGVLLPFKLLVRDIEQERALGAVQGPDTMA